MTGPDLDPSGVVVSFLTRYYLDREQGNPLAVADYQAMFPGFEETIAEEYARLSEAGEAEAAEAGPPAAPSSELEQFGPYRILASLGRGGQGSVYLAEDPNLGRKLALKVLHAAAAASPAQRERLHREAMAASRLDHPGICTVFSVGEESGLPYIAMQFIEGEPLSRCIETRRAAAASTTASSRTGSAPRDDVNETLRLIEHTARALHVAHEAGLVHRDVKPGNIMVTTDGEPVLLDFGLAREEQGDDATLTASDQILGTPAYMPPEQITGPSHALDRRADVYALGVTLYEALTLRRPFEAPTREQLYHEITASPPPDPRVYNRRIGTDLKAVLEVALEKDPHRRYRTAEAFADDLRRIQRLEPIRARPPGRWLRLRRWARRRPAAALLLVVCLVGIPALAALGGYILANQDKVAEARRARHQARVERLLERGFFALGEAHDQEGIRHFEAALRLEPDTPEAFAGLVWALVENGQAQDAVNVLTHHRAVVDRHASLARVQAFALQAVGRTEEAAAALRDLRPPANALDHFIAGVIIRPPCHDERAAAFRPALRHLVQAVHAAPHARPIYLLEQIHLAGHAEDRDAVYRASDAMATLWPDLFLTWAARGLALKRIGELTEARKAYERALGINPTYANTLLNLGNVLTALGHREEADAVYRRVLADQPDHQLTLCARARNLQKLGRAKEAEAIFESVLRDHPRNGMALGGLGIGALDEGDVQKGVRLLREAVEAGPTYSLVLARLGSALAERGEHEEAYATLKAAVTANPNSNLALDRLAAVADELGKVDEVIQVYRQLVRLEPKNVVLYQSLGTSLACAGRLADALPPFLEAIRLAPESAAPRFGVGLLYARLNDIPAAKAAYREAIRCDHAHVPAHVNLAALLRDEGRYRDAEQMFQQALRIDPDHARANYNYGLMLVRQRRNQEAVAHLRRAVATDPGYAKAHYYLGNALRRTGDLDAAASHWELATRHDPRHDRALYNLGVYWMQKEQAAKALPYLRRAAPYRRGHALTQFHLANAYRKVGRNEDAVTHFRESIRLDAKRAIAYCYLGFALQSLDRLEEAAGYFRRGHDLGRRTRGWNHPSAKWLADCEAQRKQTKAAGGTKE